MWRVPDLRIKARYTKVMPVARRFRLLKVRRTHCTEIVIEDSEVVIDGLLAVHNHGVVRLHIEASPRKVCGTVQYLVNALAPHCNRLVVLEIAHVLAFYVAVTRHRA